MCWHVSFLLGWEWTVLSLANDTGVLKPTRRD